MTDPAESVIVRPVDPSSPADLAQLAALREVCEEHAFGAHSVSSPAQIAAGLASTPYWDCSTWVAEVEQLEGGRSIAGIASLQVPLQENLDGAFLGLEVHPGLRGRGIATALIEQALAPAVEDSGRELITAFGDVRSAETADDPALPAPRLAARWGLARTSLAICRALDLPLDPALLETLGAQALESQTRGAQPEEAETGVADGYRIETWTDTVPEEHLGSYGRLLTQLDLDDPDEDTENEAAEYTPERIRMREERTRARGLRTLMAVAIAPDGSIAGNTEIQFSAVEGTTLGHQENTLVMPDHRGHGLGLAMKVANHRALEQLGTTLQRLVTWNSHVNPWMIAINERLGYEVIGAEVTYQGRRPHASGERTAP